MSVIGFLADLWQRGVVLRLSDDRHRILVPRRQLSPALRERLAHDKPEIVKLLTYVDQYRALIHAVEIADDDVAQARPHAADLQRLAAVAHPPACRRVLRCAVAHEGREAPARDVGGVTRAAVGTRPPAERKRALPALEQASPGRGGLPRPTPAVAR
jgi:hypothetical protein